MMTAASELAGAIPDRLSRPIVADHLAPIPHAWRGDMLRQWRETWETAPGSEGDRRRAANLELLDASEAARDASDVRVTADDAELVAKADAMAERCRGVALESALQWAWSVAEAVPDGDEEAMRARLVCPLWWRRVLRRYHGRTVEGLGARLHLTRRDRHLYVTNEATGRRRSQKRRNQRLLEELLAVNEAGDEYTLAELAELTVSNPVIRRGELMVRMYGFEKVAERAGHVAEFWTLTAPSRFHSATAAGPGVRSNSNWDGSTPREAQQYLSGVWSRIRAAWSREGLRPYGFRIAEPHHDGCPHWHLLLFGDAEALARAREIAGEHALKDSPHEPGAQARRFSFKAIDPARGSATGYVAKYIAKNVDGYALKHDDPGATDGAAGRDPAHVAERVDAWASTWGIRQFQQIGGPSVTVWRELRRMDWHETGSLEACREAADNGDWAAYVEAMGGTDCQASDRPVQLALWQDVDQDTGELPVNRYGELAPGRVLGVECAGQIYVTRWLRWSVVSRADAGAWSSVNNCTGGTDAKLPARLARIDRAGQNGAANKESWGDPGGGGRAIPLRH